MKTDLSFWDSNFPKIKRVPLKKLLYHKFEYRLELVVLGGRCLTKPQGGRTSKKFEKALRDLQLTVTRAQLLDKPSVENATYWARKNLFPWVDKNLDLALLRNIQKILVDNDSDIKIRTDPWDAKKRGNVVFIACNDLKILESIAILFKDTPDLITSLSYPESEEALKWLREGAIVSKYGSKYKFKVCLRSKSRLTASHLLNHRNKIADMIKELPDVYMSTIAEKRIRENYWINGSVLYTNDPTQLAFVQLVDPNIVGRIYPLVKVTDK